MVQCMLDVAVAQVEKQGIAISRLEQYCPGEWEEEARNKKGGKEDEKQEEKEGLDERHEVVERKVMVDEERVMEEDEDDYDHAQC